MSTNAKKLVEICLLHAEILGGICRFLPSRAKRCRCYARNLWSYWTNLDHICTHVATILP